MARPRTFVQYTEDGEIVAVVRATVIPEGYESPWGAPPEGERIVEVDEEDDTRELQLEVIQRRYAIDVDRLKLIER